MTQQFLRVVFSPGLAPDKWFNRFDQRMPGWTIASAQADDPMRYIDAEAADLAIVRVGCASGAAGGVDKKDRYHHVHLYNEQIGIAAPKDHPIKMEKSVQWSEVGDETIMYSTPPNGEVEVPQLREALQVVAANVGVVLGPRPLLRGINQPGVVHRDVYGVPEGVGDTQVVLIWLRDRDNDVIQDFVGICRGRTQGSSRQAVDRAGKNAARHKGVGQRARAASGTRGQEKGQAKSGKKRGKNGGRPPKGVRKGLKDR